MNKEKSKNRILFFLTRIISFIIPLFQYVPTLLWYGFMSVPFLIYVVYFFQQPEILGRDLSTFSHSSGFNFVLFGLLFFIYSLIYQLTHRKQLIKTGPYKYMRHPQYVAFIIMIFGMTSMIFETDPVLYWGLDSIINQPHVFIFYMWAAETLIYIVLGKIEDIALKAKYGDEFKEYANNVPFMFPSIKKKKEINKK